MRAILTCFDFIYGITLPTIGNQYIDNGDIHFGVCQLGVTK